MNRGDLCHLRLSKMPWARTRDKLDLSQMISYYPIFVSVRSSAYAFQIKGSTSSLNRCGSTFHSPSAISFAGRLGELARRALCAVEEG